MILFRVLLGLNSGVMEELPNGRKVTRGGPAAAPNDARLRRQQARDVTNHRCRVLWIDPFLSPTLRNPRMGLANQRKRRHFSHLAQDLCHVFRVHAVTSDHLCRLQFLHRFLGRGTVCRVKLPAVFEKDQADRNWNGRPRLGRLNHDPRLGEMGHRLDEEKVNLGTNELRNLFCKCGYDFSRRGRMRPAMKTSCGADGASNKMYGCTGPPSKVDGRRIDRRHLLGQTTRLESKAIRPERVGLDKIASDTDIRPVNLLHLLRVREVPQLRRRTPLETPGMKHRPDCPIGQQESLRETGTQPVVGFLNSLPHAPTRRGGR